MTSQPKTAVTSYKSRIPEVTRFHLKSIFDSRCTTFLSDMVSPGCKIRKHDKRPVRMKKVTFFIGHRNPTRFNQAITIDFSVAEMRRRETSWRRLAWRCSSAAKQRTPEGRWKNQAASAGLAPVAFGNRAPLGIQLSDKTRPFKDTVESNFVSYGDGCHTDPDQVFHDSRRDQIPPENASNALKVSFPAVSSPLAVFSVMS